MNQEKKIEPQFEVVAGEAVARRVRAEEPVVVPPVVSGEAGEEEVSLREYLSTLHEQRWVVAALAALVFAMGVAYLLVATPVYRSDILLQVEEKKGGLGGLDELSTMFGGQSPAEAEIEILRSRSLVGSVVDELQLDIYAEPRTFPIVGRAFARRHDAKDGIAKPLLGLGSFAWGGERVLVSRLDVRRDLAGERLTILAGENGAFTLSGPDGERILDGRVGAAASGNGVEIFVAELVGRPGTQFRAVKLVRSGAVEDLQRKLAIGEKGKKTGILRVALDGPDALRIAAILDAIGRTYVRQNVERKSAEAEKTLEFLETQLPVLKSGVDAAEAALNEYRSKKGSVDISLETQGTLQRVVEIEKALSELEVQRAELKQRFTESHPAMESIEKKRRQLDAEKASIDARIKTLPAAELQSARLMRDVKVANELYVLLLNKAQELKVVKSGTIGNVRILDTALVPLKPVSPKKGATVALSLFLGVALGVAAAFVRKMLDHGVEDPDQIEASTGLPVYATVPHSGVQKKMVREFARDRVAALPVLATTHPGELAIESLRSLRTSLQFAMMEARNNVIAVGGPSPGIGKSFVSVNLGHVLADTGKRVLLVDGDMRKGRLHEYFTGERASGLSDLISGAVSLDQAVQKGGSANIHFMSTGALPPNPSELLSSERFRQVMAAMSARYDIVLLDTPPILAVTDGALIGRLAGVNLFVLRAGKHPMREIALTIKRYAQAGVRLNGVVFNDLAAAKRGFAKYGYNYQYEYK